MKKENIWNSGTCGDFVSEERITFIESLLKNNLPRSYLSFVRMCDGGVPKKSDFEYYDFVKSRCMSSTVGGFLHLNETDDNQNFLSMWQDPPEFFPEGLVAFAEVGCGDLICFDYRRGNDNLDPPIAYWHLRFGDDRDISPLANNFEEFLKILREPEDYFGDENESDKEEE